MRAIAVVAVVLAGCAAGPREVDLVAPTVQCIAQGGLPSKVRVDAEGNVTDVLCSAVNIRRPG